MSDEVWDEVKDFVFISKEDFLAAISGYDVETFFDKSGKPTITFMSKGPEFHFITYGNEWAADKKILKKYPGELIKNYGYAKTKTPVYDIRQQRFNERLGFYKVSQDEDFIDYRIDEMKIK